MKEWQVGIGGGEAGIVDEGEGLVVDRANKLVDSRPRSRQEDVNTIFGIFRVFLLSAFVSCILMSPSPRADNNNGIENTSPASEPPYL